MYCNVSNVMSLTYHKFKKRRCHYCGYALPNLPIAILFEYRYFLPKGFGTEQIESGIGRIISNQNIKLHGSRYAR
jgi:primosomal protein N' (replication factor Y)